MIYRQLSNLIADNNGQQIKNTKAETDSRALIGANISTQNVKPSKDNTIYSVFESPNFTILHELYDVTAKPSCMGVVSPIRAIGKEIAANGCIPEKYAEKNLFNLYLHKFKKVAPATTGMLVFEFTASKLGRQYAENSLNMNELNSKLFGVFSSSIAGATIDPLSQIGYKAGVEMLKKKGSFIPMVISTQRNMLSGVAIQYPGLLPGSDELNSVKAGVGFAMSRIVDSAASIAVRVVQSQTQTSDLTLKDVSKNILGNLRTKMTLKPTLANAFCGYVYGSGGTLLCQKLKESI